MSQPPERMNAEELIAEVHRLRSERSRTTFEQPTLLERHKLLRARHGRFDQVSRPPAATQEVGETQETHQQLAELNRILVERNREAEDRSRQLHQLATQLTQAENRERRRLALLLHDGLQQLLIAARMKVGALELKLKGDPHIALARQATGLIDEAIAASRSLSVELSPPMLYEAGLGAALDWLGDQMEEKHGLQVKIKVSGEPEDEDIRIFLFQCVRELLFNIVKHAQVGGAQLTMQRADDEHVLVTVFDAGRGFDLDSVRRGWLSSDSFGLRSIHERLRLLGGCCEIESAPGRGTRVSLIVPVRKPPPLPFHAPSAESPDAGAV